MEPCPRCHAPFVTEKLTKRSGTVRRCAREGCGWQARLDEDDGRWVEMADQPPRGQDGSHAAPSVAGGRRRRRRGGAGQEGGGQGRGGQARPGETRPQEAGAPEDGGRRAADGREGPRGARHAMRRA